MFVKLLKILQMQLILRIKIMAAKNTNPVYSSISNYGIIPEIRAENAETALSLARELADGGLNIAEITDAAAIKEISSALPDMLLIAGNVASKEQAKAAVGFGAKAVVSAGFDEALASACAGAGIPLIASCVTSGELEAALGAGVAVQTAAGSKEVEELCARCPKAKFIVSGAADGGNFPEYLSYGAVIACSGNFTARAVGQMLGFDLAHVVINCENTEQAERYSSRVEAIFGLGKTDAGATFSNADILHFTKQRSYGKNGQVAICSNFIDRAVFYLKQAGRQFIEESARYDEKNKLVSIYLDNIIGGFAIKLVRK